MTIKVQTIPLVLEAKHNDNGAVVLCVRRANEAEHEEDEYHISANAARELAQGLIYAADDADAVDA